MIYIEMYLGNLGIIFKIIREYPLKIWKILGGTLIEFSKITTFLK